MKYLVYSGVFVLFVLTQLPISHFMFFGVVVSNVLIMGLTVLYLKKFMNAKGVKQDSMYEIKPGILVLLSMMSLGFIHCALWIIEYHKYPIKEGMTDEDMANRANIKYRNKKFKKVLNS